jgi:lipoprotein-anchoring transpeptidase ErfK/SrfK
MLATRVARRAWAELGEGRGRGLVDQALAAQPAAGDEDGAVPPDPHSPLLITISRRTRKLRLYERGAHVKTYRISVGSERYETRPGLYAIQNKVVDPEWLVPGSSWAGELAGKSIPPGVPENEMKARWLGVYSDVGIHGTEKETLRGRRMPPSRGCIRMPVADVIDLCERVPVGTPVFIA